MTHANVMNSVEVETLAGFEVELHELLGLRLAEALVGNTVDDLLAAVDAEGGGDGAHQLFELHVVSGVVAKAVVAGVAKVVHIELSETIVIEVMVVAVSEGRHVVVERTGVVVMVVTVEFLHRCGFV